MRCEDLLGRLEAYANGQMSPAEWDAAAAHLRNCAACTRGLARVDRLAALLGQGQTPPVPTGFVARLMTAARRRQLPMTAVGWNPVRWWKLGSVPMHAAAAAVLIVGLAVGMVMGWTTATSTARAPAPDGVAEADALDAYNVDCLTEAPTGSLADSYLTLLVTSNEGGR